MESFGISFKLEFIFTYSPESKVYLSLLIFGSVVLR